MRLDPNKYLNSKKAAPAEQPDVFAGKATYSNSSVMDRIETIQNYADTIYISESTRRPMALNEQRWLIPDPKKQPNPELLKAVEEAQNDLGGACLSCIDVAGDLARLGLEGDGLLRDFKKGKIDIGEFNKKLTTLQEKRDDLIGRAKAALKEVNAKAAVICGFAKVPPIVIDDKDPLQAIMDITYEYERRGKNLDKIYEIAQDELKRRSVKLPTKTHSDVVKDVLGKEAEDVVKDAKRVKAPSLIGLPLQRAKDDIDLIIVEKIPEELLQKEGSMRHQLIRVMDDKTGEFYRKPAIMFEKETKRGPAKMYIQRSEWDKLVSDAVPVINGDVINKTGGPTFPHEIKAEGRQAEVLHECGYDEFKKQSPSEVKDIFKKALTYDGVTETSIKQYLNMLKNLHGRDPERIRRDMKTIEEVRYEKNIDGKNPAAGKNVSVRDIRE